MFDKEEKISYNRYIKIIFRGFVVKEHLKDLYNYLSERRCKDISIYDLSEEDHGCDFIYVATCNNIANNKKLALSIMQDFEMEKYPEGYHKGEWIIFDFDQCVVHLFTGATRDKYNLDKLWQSKKMAI